MVVAVTNSPQQNPSNPHNGNGGDDGDGGDGGGGGNGGGDGGGNDDGNGNGLRDPADCDEVSSIEKDIISDVSRFDLQTS